MWLLGVMEWEYDPSDVRRVFFISRQLTEIVLLASLGYLRAIWSSSSLANSTSSFCPSLGFLVE
jgi:hypothetical protein